MYYTGSLLEPRTYLKENYFYRTLKFTKIQFTNSQELISQITTSAILKNTKTTLKKPGMELDLLSALRQTLINKLDP